MALASELAPRLVRALLAPPRRPLAIGGRSGSGKTTLLRTAVRDSGCHARWETAFDLVGKMVTAMRVGRYDRFWESFIEEGRAICIEHLEELSGKPVTRGEIRRLIEARAARGHAVLLTVTSARQGGDVVEWLESWAELLRLE